MTSTTKNFKSAAEAVIQDVEVQSHLKGLYSGFNMARIREEEATYNWQHNQNREQAVNILSLIHI